MKNFAIITAVVASLAAPTFAQSASDLAIQNHNGSAASNSDLIAQGVNGLTMGVTASTRGNSALAQAIAVNNASADTASDRIDGRFVTTFSNTPGHAADIFDRLAAESRGEEG